VPQLIQSPHLELFQSYKVTPVKQALISSETKDDIKEDLDKVVIELLNKLGVLAIVGTAPAGKTALVGVALNVAEIEAEVAECLAFIRETSYSLMKAGASEMLNDTIVDLVETMERLEDLPGSLTSQPANSSYFHTWLEVRWTVLVCCYHQKDITDVPALLRIDSGPGWLEQAVKATVIDLVVVAAKKTINSELSHKNISVLSPFGCPCTEEMWKCLYKISLSSGQDFWQILSLSCPESALNNQQESDLGVLVYHPSSQTPLQFWNLLYSLLSLLHGDGQEMTSQSSQGLYKSGRLRLRQIIKLMEASLDESILRSVLKVLVYISSLAPPSLDIIGELWKLFSKVPILNSPLRLKTMTMEGAACLPKSPTDWFAQIQDLSREADKSTATSFTLFLSIISQSISKWMPNTSIVPKEVTTLAGRISISLSKKKAEGLNEYGVFHLSSLLMVLARSDPIPNSTKLLELLDQVQPHERSLLLLILKSRLTLLLLLVDRQVDITLAGTAASQQVSAAVSQSLDNQKDVLSKRLAQDYVEMFISTFVEVIHESPKLRLGEECLIQPWVDKYLRQCSSSEIPTIITAMNQVLTRARLLINTRPPPHLRTVEDEAYDSCLARIVTQLWAVIYPSVRHLATCLTASPKVATLAADLAIQAAEQASRGGEKPCRDSLEEMVEYFTSFMASPEVSTVFLGRLINNPTLTERLRMEGASDNLLLNSWCRGCLVTSPEAMHYPTHRATWTSLADQNGLDATSDEDVLIQFLKQATFKQSGAVKKLAEECCNRLKWGKGLGRVYQVAGRITRHCYALLYRPGGSGSATVLITLVTTLLTPRMISSGATSTWAPSEEQKLGLKRSLGDFVTGLASYPNFDQDKFLMEAIQNIVRNYLPRFSLSDHPLLPLLSRPSLPLPSSSIEKVQTLTLQTITKFLMKQSIEHTTTTTASIQYLTACFKNTSGQIRAKIIKEALLVLLEVASLTNATNTNLQLRTGANKILESIFAFVEESGGDCEDATKDIINVFVTKNLAYNADRVFVRLQMTGKFAPKLISKSLANVEIQVAKTEQKRGVGQDNKLRKHLANLKDMIKEGVELF